MYLNNKIWQWTTEIERSFGQNFVTGIAYVGSAGSHLDMPVQNWNNPDPGLGSVQNRRPYQFYVDSRTPDTLLPARDRTPTRVMDQLQLSCSAGARGETVLAWIDIQRVLQFPKSHVHRLWGE